MWAIKENSNGLWSIVNEFTDFQITIKGGVSKELAQILAEQLNKHNETQWEKVIKSLMERHIRALETLKYVSQEISMLIKEQNASS